MPKASHYATPSTLPGNSQREFFIDLEFWQISGLREIVLNIKAPPSLEKNMSKFAQYHLSSA
jgi:hypothetical protein